MVRASPFSSFCHGPNFPGIPQHWNSGNCSTFTPAEYVLTTPLVDNRDAYNVNRGNAIFGPNPRSRNIGLTPYPWSGVHRDTMHTLIRSLIQALVPSTNTRKPTVAAALQPEANSGDRHQSGAGPAEGGRKKHRKRS